MFAQKAGIYHPRMNSIQLIWKESDQLVLKHGEMQQMPMVFLHSLRVTIIKNSGASVPLHISGHLVKKVIFIHPIVCI